MKIPITLTIAILVLTGCRYTTPANSSQPEHAAQKPCLPSVGEEMKQGKQGNLHQATIENIKDSHDEKPWKVTHRTTCAENEATVMPSVRMYMYADQKIGFGDAADKWLAEHTFCQPDGLGNLRPR